MLKAYRFDDLFEYLDAVANSLESKNAEERVVHYQTEEKSLSTGLKEENVQSHIFRF